MKPLRPHGEPLPDPGFETLAVHYAEDAAERHGAAAPAIYQTSTFIYPDMAAFEKRRRTDQPYYDYTRGGNPTTSILEAKLARLEHGDWCECFGSGMGAISAAINTSVHAGAHVVCVAHVYGPARWYLDHLKRFGVETTFVSGVRAEDFAAAMRPETNLLYLESPTSGHFDVLDLDAIAAAARARGVTVLCDNSWASPVFQNPLDHGADMVVHSATKYLGGHSDVVAGVVIGRGEDLQRRIWREVELCGATLDPFGGWLLLRGLRTLALRMRHFHEAGLLIARRLAEHPKVARVLHPGLPSHPQHDLARKYLRGYGSLFSFEPREQSKEAVHRFIHALKLFQIGVSWGGHESLALGGSFFSDDPARPVHLIRLHVGLETPEDLLRDVESALAAL